MRGLLSLGILGRDIAAIHFASVRGIFWSVGHNSQGRLWVRILELERGNRGITGGCDRWFRF